MRANQHIQKLSQAAGHKAEVFGGGLLQGKPNIVINNNYNQKVVAYINH